MALIYQSTLNEVEMCLCVVGYRILNKMMPEFWQEQAQVVYSTVDEWDTAYRSYLEFNKIPDVKFPFATITRESTQITQRPFGEPIRLADRRQASADVNGVLIKQCKCEFSFTLYEKQYGTLEMFADFIIAQGWETQRVDFNSEVLKAPSRFSFVFGEPSKVMIADKNKKLNENGHIYSLTIPITVDTVLGIATNEKLITEVVACINDLLSETTLETITVEGEPEAIPIDETDSLAEDPCPPNDNPNCC